VRIGKASVLFGVVGVVVFVLCSAAQAADTVFDDGANHSYTAPCSGTSATTVAWQY